MVLTHSLAEVAAEHLPPEWTDGVRWLARRLNRDELRGYRVGRIWRMTEADVEFFLAKHSNLAAVPALVSPPTEPIDTSSTRRLPQRRQLDPQKPDFEEFGGVAFETRPRSFVAGLSPRSRSRLGSA